MTYSPSFGGEKKLKKKTITLYIFLERLTSKNG